VRKTGPDRLDGLRGLRFKHYSNSKSSSRRRSTPHEALRIRGERQRGDLGDPDLKDVAQTVGDRGRVLAEPFKRLRRKEGEATFYVTREGPQKKGKTSHHVWWEGVKKTHPRRRRTHCIKVWKYDLHDPFEKNREMRPIKSSRSDNR